MFLICRKDTHSATGDVSFAWFGDVWQEPFASKDAAIEKAEKLAAYFVANEKKKDSESVTVVSETEFIYNYFGATRVEFSVVEVKPC